MCNEGRVSVTSPFVSPVIAVSVSQPRRSGDEWPRPPSNGPLQDQALWFQGFAASTNISPEMLGCMKCTGLQADFLAPLIFGVFLGFRRNGSKLSECPPKFEGFRQKMIFIPKIRLNSHMWMGKNGN